MNGAFGSRFAQQMAWSAIQDCRHGSLVTNGICWTVELFLLFFLMLFRGKEVGTWTDSRAHQRIIGTRREVLNTEMAVDFDLITFALL